VLVPPDSVETAIALDTESKPEPQFLDSVSESIALDTESKPEPQFLDSVSYQFRPYCRNDILEEGQECNEDKLCLNV